VILEGDKIELKKCSNCHGNVFRGKYFETDDNKIPVFLHLTCIEEYKKLVNKNVGRHVEFKEIQDLKWNFTLKVYH
jgi:hypothetical protein